MRDLNVVAEQLFNEIRGRFPSVTIGDGEGNTTNEPYQARFYEFDYKSNGNSLGKVSVSLDEKSGVTIMYNKDFTENAGIDEEDNWYNFLKGMRNFAKKRLLNFEVRDINKSNFTQRDYSYMAANRGETAMNESALRGTDKTSFQKIGNAKLRIKHTGPIGEGESRTKKIGSLFIENAEGEKFKYPFKHLSGARAMAIHVSEGGHPFDDFGKHITSLSEELSNLRKFKTYMGRSSVMAESLAEHMDTVNERIVAVKKTIQNLQKPSNYKTAFESFEPSDAVEVPEEVAENWIDQLTVKQFNEELKDVFPYIYKLVGESTKANELDFDDIVAEARVDEALPVILGLLGLAGAAGYAAYKKLGASNSPLGKALQKAAQEGDTEAAEHLKNLGAYADGGDSKTLKMLKFKYLDEPASMNTESAVDAAFDKLLGQFADNFSAQVEGDTDEGNAYAHAVRKAKMNGAKKGDKIDHPDSDEDDIVIEKDKTPLGEFILSYFDRQTGKFPKGETAVLTSIEKDYGDQYVKPASQFIKRLGQAYEQYQQKKLGQVDLEEAGNFQDFASKFRAIQKRGGNVAVSIHGLLKDFGLDADQIMGFDPTIPSNRTKANQFQSSRQEEVLQKAQDAMPAQSGPAAARRNPEVRARRMGGQDLGNGFQKVKHPEYGDAILDTQSGSVIFVNAGKVRSPGKYVVLQSNGKIQTTNQLGPMSTQAMQDAGLGESQNLDRIQELAGLR